MLCRLYAGQNLLRACVIVASVNSDISIEWKSSRHLTEFKEGLVLQYIVSSYERKKGKVPHGI